MIKTNEKEQEAKKLRLIHLENLPLLDLLKFVRECARKVRDKKPVPTFYKWTAHYLANDLIPRDSPDQWVYSWDKVEEWNYGKYLNDLLKLLRKQEDYRIQEEEVIKTDNLILFNKEEKNDATQVKVDTELKKLVIIFENGESKMIYVNINDKNALKQWLQEKKIQIVREG